MTNKTYHIGFAGVATKDGRQIDSISFPGPVPIIGGGIRVGTCHPVHAIPLNHHGFPRHAVALFADCELFGRLADDRFLSIDLADMLVDRDRDNVQHISGRLAGLTITPLTEWPWEPPYYPDGKIVPIQLEKKPMPTDPYVTLSEEFRGVFDIGDPVIARNGAFPARITAIGEYNFLSIPLALPDGADGKIAEQRCSIATGWKHWRPPVEREFTVRCELRDELKVGDVFIDGSGRVSYAGDLSGPIEPRWVLLNVNEVPLEYIPESYDD